MSHRTVEFSDFKTGAKSIVSLIKIQTSLLKFYDQHKRDLPWRTYTGRPPAYHVLVSELMLQQTQVVTVIAYFNRFIAAFPTLTDLARADEQQVLRLWQGLGYYSRARNLHQCAKAIVLDHAGVIPSDVATLLTLPGIGPYTAGAIASIAYDRPAAIVDGNVMRVISRLDALTADPRQRLASLRIWARAGELVPQDRAGDFNSALMELGATICTPKSPKCLVCPVQQECKALAKGIVDQIPPPKVRKEKPVEKRDVLCISQTTLGVTRWLVEQRPSKGRWAGMWQFVTRDVADRPHIDSLHITHLGQITHELTHRSYEFDAWRVMCEGAETSLPTSAISCTRWASASDLDEMPMPRPHVRIREMIGI